MPSLKVFKTQVINDWERTRKGARAEQRGESPRTSARGNQAADWQRRRRDRDGELPLNGCCKGKLRRGERWKGKEDTHSFKKLG